MSTTVQEPEAVGREVRTAVRHSAVYGLGAVAVKALGFLLLPLYTHYLHPADYGILEILDLSMALLGMVLNMGMTAALLRYYAAAETERDKRKVVSTAFLFVVVTGAGMFFLAMAFIRPVSTLLFGPNVPSTYLLISFASFVLAYIANLPRTYLRAMEASGTFVLLDTVTLFLMVVLNVFFIVVLNTGLLGILLSALLVNIAWAGVSVWVFRRVGIRFSRSLLRQMLGFGLPLIFSNLALFTLNFADRFFLKHFQSLEVVGIYAVGYKFGYMMSFLLVQPFNVMWQSRMYVLHTQPDHPKIFGQMFVLYAVVLTYAGLALSILSPEIAHVMVDSKFSSSQNVIPLVALAYIFCGLGYFMQVGMFLTKKTEVIGVISAATAVLCLAFNYFLILHYGMLGAAWATMLSFLVNTAATYWFSQRVFPLPLGVGRVALMIALGAGLHVLSQWWQPHSVGLTVAMKGFLLAAFPVLLWKTRILSSAEIGTIVSAKDDLWVRVSRLVRLDAGKAVSL